jgi:hypothetical protein
MRPTSLSIFAGLLLSATPLLAQGINPAHPKEIEAQHHASSEEVRDRQAGSQLNKDADELAALCASLQSDLDRLKQGTLSKDILDKLKHMEKLSKRVRDELSHASAPPQ